MGRYRTRGAAGALWAAVTAAGIFLVAVDVAAAQSGGSNYCVRTSTYATALRGPNTSTATAENGCGSYNFAIADPNNSSEAGYYDSVRYTSKYTRAQAGGYHYTAIGDEPTESIASSSADLADATLHAFGQSSRYAQGTARAGWSDLLHFSNSTGVEQFVPVYWTVEGSASFNPDSVGSVTSNLDISEHGSAGSSNGGFYYELDPQGRYDLRTENASSTWQQNFSVRDLGGASREFSSIFGIGAGDTLADIYAGLSVDARDGSTGDFGNTAKFRFGPLPDGVSFFSDSGVFASEPNTGVSAAPEPASWLLMILGVGALGLSFRSRTTRPSFA